MIELLAVCSITLSKPICREQGGVTVKAAAEGDEVVADYIEVRRGPMGYIIVADAYRNPRACFIMTGRDDLIVRLTEPLRFHFGFVVKRSDKGCFDRESD